MEIELQTVENRETARKFKPVIRDHRGKLIEYEQALQWSQAGAADDVGNNKSGYNAGTAHTLHTLYAHIRTHR